MNEIPRRPVLNPAFKRFQYLPHLSSSAPSKHECAAPAKARRTGEQRGPEQLSARRTTEPFQAKPSAEGPVEGRLRKPICEFQSPV